jgi:hypothetical protein
MSEASPCDVHDIRIKSCEERLEKLDVILEKVRMRPPVWATFVMGLLMAGIGYLIGQ